MSRDDFNKTVPVEQGSLRSLQKQVGDRPPKEPPAGQPIVGVVLDDERTTAVLLTAPNAIGICKLVRYEVQFERHVNRIEARNDAARALLANRDAIVEAASSFAEKMEDLPVVALTRAATPPPGGIPLRAIEDVYNHLRARYAENEVRFRRSGSRGARKAAHNEKHRVAALLAYAKDWRSEARRNANAMQSGLSADEVNDPVAIISGFVRIMARLVGEHAAAHPGEHLLTHEEGRLVTAGRSYVQTHHRVKYE